MTATSSPSPSELYSTMRSSGRSAAAASVLDLYCAPARGPVANSNGCRGDVSPAPCCSPDGSSRISPVDLQSMSGTAAIEATALRLMLAGGRQPLAHHQGALPPLSLLGAGSSMSAAMHGGQVPSAHRHHSVHEASAFYLPQNLQLAAEMSSPDAWNGIYNSTIGLSSFDARANVDYQSYLQCYGGLHDVRRKNATRESTSTLKTWLIQHIKNPYPTKGEKIMLAIITKMTLTQVSTWFANARRRLKKENKMQWSPRQRSGDDDDDDADDDDSPNDVMNASFGASDDEYSNDVISDDRGLTGSRSPESRLSSDTVNDNSDDHVTSFDHRTTYSGLERHRLPFDRTSTSHQFRHHAVDGRTSRPLSSMALDARKSTASEGVVNDVSDDDRPATSNKPRIWSIAELVAPSGDRGNDTPTTSCRQTKSTSSSSSSPSQHCGENVIDYRSLNAALQANANDALNTYFRRQLTASSSAAANVADQVMFPVAAVEAIRWQMAAAACRAATAAAAQATPNRFDSTGPSNSVSEGNCASSSALVLR